MMEEENSMMHTVDGWLELTRNTNPVHGKTHFIGSEVLHVDLKKKTLEVRDPKVRRYKDKRTLNSIGR